MEKTRTKRILAITLATAVVAAGSLTTAYFAKNARPTGANGSDDIQKIDITNGKVEISGKVGSTTLTTFDWSYDVATSSTLPADVTAMKANTTQYPFTSNPTTMADIIADTGDYLIYQNAHRSPDINATTKTPVSPESFGRAVIGSSFTSSSVSMARPGDAIVLGQAGSANDEGLVITNSSNLMTKYEVKLRSSAASIAMLDAMKAAGWKLYVMSGTETTYTEITTLAADVTIASGTLAVGSNPANVKIKMELPVSAGNTYENAKVGASGSEVIDLSNMIALNITQENNPGWLENGQ